MDRHNLKFDRGATTFRLAVNEHLDRSLQQLCSSFPPTTLPAQSFGTPPPAVDAAAPSYDPINDFGFVPNIENQGTVCNSGWAYSAAKSIELLQAQQTGNMTPLSLSAQNLIDCAGSGRGCTHQVPQAAFDYLTRFNMDLLLTADYPNDNTLIEQGMCTPRGDLVTNLASYSRLQDGEDSLLMAYLSNGYPIVVEMSPCYIEFMQYSSGVYQQPPNERKCSHFVLLLGYGSDASTGMNYWLVQNSFGRHWGENGLMKLERSPSKRVFKNAIFPVELS